MSDNDIAVIGLAGRFPGARTVAEFWGNVRDGVESIRSLSEEELLAAGVSADEMRDPAYVRACPVMEGIDEFDAKFFGFSPRDAAVMDPAHRVFLEVAWEAVEHSGQTALPEEAVVGVFAGSGAPYYLMDNVRRNRELMRSMGEFLVRHTNNDMNFLATRVSYEMDLRGPSVNIQTACSSALVSVHMACESIRRGECTIALAGGSTVLVPDRQGYLYQEGEIMSPDGHCRPFDEKSAGTVFGSGCGCVVLKRLSAALDDGDTIHAVIKGSAINNDGAQRVGYLAPGVEGQAAVVKRALDQANVPADTITYIEAHGTGTSVGDPIEVAALNQAFEGRTDRRHFCAIGSVKSNIGHLGEAAGVASLIKAIMALQHRQLPPSLGYHKANPQIDFDNSPFFVNDRLRSWEASGPRRCGVTALGAGGTNCHVILEEAPESIPGEGARGAQLFVLSAKSPESLEQAADDLAQAIEGDASLDLADVAYTLALGRRHMPHRRIVVAGDRDGAIERLRARGKQAVTQRAEEHAGSVVFMFPGGGAQYARMGIDLYESEEVYRSAVDECLAIANARLGRDLGALMFSSADGASDAAQALERPSLSLPSLFTTEYALARLFQAWGVEPTAFIGHSMGEYVAACLSGVIALDSALELVMMRGRLFEEVPRGRMLSVSLPEGELRPLLPAGLDIAAVNAHGLCVASGPEALIASLEKILDERQVDHKRVRIDVAAHSSMLEPILEQFRQFCRTIEFRAPQTPFVSNLTGTWITTAQATDPEYWVKHLRSTVRFADGVETLLADGERVLVEIGPGRTLASLARAQRHAPRNAFNSMRHPDEVGSDLDFALLTLGKVWMSGAATEWSAFYEGQLRNRVPLPTYSWDHQRHWIDAPVAAMTEALASAVVVDGARRQSVEDWFERPVWRQTLPPPVLRKADESVLVFGNRGGFVDLLSQRLESAGRRVFRVTHGATWAQAGDSFTLDRSSLADCEKLLKSLAADGGLPRRVVHAWLAEESLPSSGVDTAVDAGFHSLLSFAQALSNVDPDAAFTLDVLTSNLQRIGGEESLQPLKALALGPARVMPREFPNVRSRAIDVVLTSNPAHRAPLAALVAAEIASDPEDSTVAFRGHDRFAQALESVSLGAPANRLRAGGVYLITGGLGGIGFTVAEHLARTQRAKLVLIGRGRSAGQARDRMAALEHLGAEVEVVQADVTNVSQMSAAIAHAKSRFGALHGVFHAAGTLGDSLMALKTRDDAERVLAPKVQGTLALDAALGDTEIDLFVLFSSISSIAGLPGQADYTAANAFLDAFAAERSARKGSFTIAINWSGWRDVGMAANIASGAGAGGGVGDEIHPLLGRRIWGSSEAELFASDLSLTTHWVVREHRLRGGRSLMPGTGHLEIARAALETRPESRTVEIRDLTFMSALGIPEHEPREMRVHLARNGTASQGLVIASRVQDGDGPAAWQEHVTATVGYVDASAGSLDIASISARCAVREDAFTPAQDSVNMDFGPRWKNLCSIRYGKDEALVMLSLPKQFADDLDVYRLHPALMDMATGRCEALIPGFDPANDFYVPLSYTRVRMFHPLTPRIYSHVRVAPNDFNPKELIVFDVTITDESGRVLVEVDEFVMTRLTDRSQLQEANTRVGMRRSHASFEIPSTPMQAPPLLRWLDGGIRPSEGMEAINRIISGPALSQLFATPRPVASLIAEMLVPQTPSPAASKPAIKPLARIAATEKSLASHPAIANAIVLERFDRTGKRHVVGYVVGRNGENPTVSDLRRFVKKAVAPSEVPGTIIQLESFPVTGDGAVDLTALHDPFGMADDYIAPRTPTEIMIASIWKDALGVERVGVRDNFFDIGGHSLLAVRAVVKLDKAVGVRLNQAIMILQTLEQISADVDRQLGSQNGVLASSDAPSGGVVEQAGESPSAQRGLFRSIRNAMAGKTK